MAVWETNPAVLNELVDILRDFSAPDTTTQRIVQQRWSNFESTHQDASLYLLKIAISSNSAQTSQLAALLLRRSIDRAKLLPDWMKEILKTGLLEAISNSNKELREAASAALCSLYTHEGYKKWPQLPTLLFNLILSDKNSSASLGAAGSLYDICLELINKDPDFAQFITNQLLPQVNNCRFGNVASGNLIARNFFGKLICLIMESLGNELIFTVYFQLIWDYVIDNLQLIGKINTNSPFICELSLSVMKIINESWNCNPEVIIASIDMIILFILQTPELLSRLNIQDDKISSFQIESLDLFPRILRANTQNNSMDHEDRTKTAIVRALEKHLPRLIPYLVNLTRYSEADYMSMDLSQLENNNSQVPDREQDISIKYPNGVESDDLNEIEDDFQGNIGSTWGSIWTTRKAAALALDYLAVSFGHRLLDDILKLIEQRLSDSNWEISESAVLALGAIARGCSSSLAPFLPKVLPYLFELSKHEKPLMRSIACWCVSRFSGWASSPENSSYWVGQLTNTLLDRILDNNKRVQEAACSALATLIEESYEHITLHFEPICSVIYKAFKFYQCTNSLLLYDILGEMIEAEERCYLEGYKDDKIIFNLQGKKISLRHFIYSQLSTDWHEIYKSSCNVSALWIAKYAAITDCTSTLLRSERENMDLQLFNPNIVLNVLHRVITRVVDFDFPMGIYESSFDVLSATVEYYGSSVIGTIESLPNFVPLVIQSISKCNGSALAAGLALIGDLSFKLSALLVPDMQMILKILSGAIGTYVDKLNSEASTQSIFPIVNNATWAIGALCDAIALQPNSTLEYSFSPHLNQFFNSLAVALRCNNPIASSGACTALGKFAKAFPNYMKNMIFTILGLWSTVALNLKSPCDKELVVFAISTALEASNVTRIDRNDLSCAIRLLASISNHDPSAVVSSRVLQKIRDSLSVEEWNFVTCQ